MMSKGIAAQSVMIGELAEKLDALEVKTEADNEKLVAAADEIGQQVRQIGVEADVKAELLIGDVGSMLGDQTEDVIARIKLELVDDIVARVTRRLANDTMFADRIAAAVVARQKVEDPTFFASSVRAAMQPTTNWSSSGSLYTLPLTPSTPLSPSSPVLPSTSVSPNNSVKRVRRRL